MTDQPEEKNTLSRRAVLTGLGIGATGLVAGGIVGREVIGKTAEAEPRIETPVTYVGRNLADCTGCRHCEIACSKYHEDVIWPAASRVRVYEYPPSVELPVLCYQCGDVPCVRECPEGALSVETESGTVVIDSEKCLRVTEGSDCTVCADACPGNTIAMHPKEDVPMFCDLCGGDPECVKVCPTATLTLNGVRLAASLPQDHAAGVALAYQVNEDPGVEPPTMAGTMNIDQMFT